MTRRILIALFVVTLAVPCAALAQSALFVVRHAERADAGMATVSDPDLSAGGRARAEALASMLKEARITAIYVTEFKRTRQTAEPLAKAMGLEPIVISSKDTPGLVARVKASPGNALIVGHSNTVPEIVEALGGDPVTIAESDYDNLFIVTAAGSLRLHYR